MCVFRFLGKTLIDLLKIIDNTRNVIAIESFMNLVAVLPDLLFFISDIQLIMLLGVITWNLKGFCFLVMKDKKKHASLSPMVFSLFLLYLLLLRSCDLAPEQWLCYQ